MNILHTSLIEFDISQQKFKEISVDEIDIHSQDNKIYWIHCNLNQKELFEKLSVKLNLPKQIISLCTQKNPIPKLIENNETLSIKIEILLSNEFTKPNNILFSNIIFHLTEKFCFTAAATPTPALNTFNEDYQKYLKYAKTPCFILFLILDNIINDFSKILLDLELAADKIDLEIREAPTTVYSDVMVTKNQVMKVQHHIAIIRDFLMRISGRKIHVISKECRLSLANLLDHSQIIFKEAEAIREILKNTLEQIDNALMQKMSNSMRILTAFAAIFLPITLIAAIYGMNFHWIPELEWEYGYFWALGLMLFCGIFLFLLFRKKKWW